MKRILLFGASGLLGFALASILRKKDLEMITPSHKDCDINDHIKIRRIGKSSQPSVIMNCTAFQGHEACEEQPDKALATNTLAVKNLAQTAEILGATMVQMSSSAIFDGRSKYPYTEEDIPNPGNIFGGTKYLGEAMVKNWCSRHFIFRLPMLFGSGIPTDSNFVGKMLNRLQEPNSTIKVSTDEINSPTYALDAAGMILYIIDNKHPYGLYHICNQGSASLFKIVDTIKLLINSTSKVVPVTHDFFPRQAAKPLQSALKSNITKEGRPWQEALEEWIRSLNFPT